jgi:hypothetical protein
MRASWNRWGWLQIALLGTICVWGIGCGGYGEISPSAYQYAKALYGISNRQREEKLAAVDAQILAAYDRGEISAQEAEWFDLIIEDAANGHWIAAQTAARRMMEDQVH